MNVKIDGRLVSADQLWYPDMNFGQFRWDAPIGTYELEIPRKDFVVRMAPEYAELVAELQGGGELPHDASALRDAHCPALEALPDHTEALLEALAVYLWETLLWKFLGPPSPNAGFMVNSIGHALASENAVVVRGRGYHGSPGFAIGS